MTNKKRLIASAWVSVSIILGACGGIASSSTRTATPTTPLTSTPNITVQPTLIQTLLPTTGPVPTQLTVYPVTVTLSGPLLGYDRTYLSKLMATVPSQLGGFDVNVPEQGFDGTAFLSVSNKDVSLTITINIRPTGSAYNAYRLNLAHIPNGEVVLIGDGAIVNSQSDNKVAYMFYRNAEAWIESPWDALNFDPRPTTLPFTNDQLIGILKDLYEKVLKNAP